MCAYLCQADKIRAYRTQCCNVQCLFTLEIYFAKMLSADGDEPLLSGTGMVSKDCSEDVLDSWAEVLNRWKSTKQRPKQLTSLVRLGIPEALRGEVWQRLAGTEENTHMMEKYRILITKVTSSFYSLFFT